MITAIANCQLSPHRFFLKVSYFELRENLGCHWGKLGVSVQYIHLQGVKYPFFGFFRCSLDQVSFASKRNQPLGVASFYRHRIFLKYVSEEKRTDRHLQQEEESEVVR